MPKRVVTPSTSTIPRFCSLLHSELDAILEDKVKRVLPFIVFVWALPVFGQTQTVCRNLNDSGGFIYQGETVINGQACRQVSYAPVADPKPTPAVSAPVNSAPNPATTETLPAPAPVQPAAASAPAAAAFDPAPASGQIPAGGVIAIAPMGGFDTYLAAAIREKKTPVQLTIDPAQSAYLLVSSEYEWQGWFATSSGYAHGSANWNSSGGTANYHAQSASNAGSTRGLEASLMLIDKKTGRILWAYEVHKSSHGSLLFGTLGMRGQQSIAEACAKHLKEYIEKGKG